MIAFSYKTKKELKASVGKPLRYQETSWFGEEYVADGKMVGVVSLQPDRVRNSFATVTMENGLIKKVS